MQSSLEINSNQSKKVLGKWLNIYFLVWMLYIVWKTITIWKVHVHYINKSGLMLHASYDHSKQSSDQSLPRLCLSTIDGNNSEVEISKSIFNFVISRFFCIHVLALTRNKLPIFINLFPVLYSFWFLKKLCYTKFP